MSTALTGPFSEGCLAAPSAGFTFSWLFLLRVNVEMDKVGREEEEEEEEETAGGVVAALATKGFSGERESATVAEGVLSCEDEGWLDGWLDGWLEWLVRREALRERRKAVPMSATEEEMLCRDTCFLRGGVEGTIGAGSYWPGA